MSASISVALGAIENSACFCSLADGEVTIPDWLNLFNYVAGYDWKAEDMMRAGRRVFYLKRLINYRFGLTAKDDDLSPRMLEPARDGEVQGLQVDLPTMKAEFYDLMRMDHDIGIPTKDALEDIGMAEEAKRVW
jgi:aldehyde:ferredoxin oxidoreductase